MDDYQLIKTLFSSNKKALNEEGCIIIKNILDKSEKNETFLKELLEQLDHDLKSELVDEQCIAIHLAICLLCHSKHPRLLVYTCESKLNILKSILQFVCNKNQEIRLNSNYFVKQACLIEPLIFMQLASEIFFPKIIIINESLSLLNTKENESIYFNLAKELDNIIQCFKYIVDALTMSIDPNLSNQFIDCIKLSSKCEDRLTRESSFDLLLSIIKSQEFFTDISPLLMDDIVGIILLGLADNFSQVRLPACLNAKEFLIHVTDNVKKNYLIILLPGLCLNRYYTAQGVSNLSQEIWEKETSGQGQILVENFFNSIILFYENQLVLTNYEVQDTVSICINEALLKLSKDIVLPYIERIIQMVETLMSHWHWSVRDSACITASSLFKIYNQDCYQHIEAFTIKLFELLVECSPRIREAAAIALATMFSVCGQEYQLIIIQKIESFLIEMSNENNYIEEILSPTQAKNKIFKLVNTPIEISQDNTNDINLQKSSQSDASSSNLKKICILNENNISKITISKRSSENWELIEGYLCLICQLAKYKEHNELTIKFLLKFKVFLETKNYSKCPYLMQSFLKQLPEVFANLEKLYLKRYCEEFFDLTFGCVLSSNDELASSSQECIHLISKQFGQNMFKLRVQKYNPNYTKFC